MAGPCECRDAGCACCFVENPDSGVPYTVYGSGAAGNCVKLDIKNIVTTIASNPNGTLTYTNETGATVTWFNGDHYSVDVLGVLTANATVPNVAVGGLTAFGPLNPLTVTIVNPSTTRQMSVHTQGTGEEVAMVGAQISGASGYVAVTCQYSANGAPAVYPNSGGGDIAFPIRNGELRTANGHSAPPIFVAVVGPSASWFCRLTQRFYRLTAPLTAGSVITEGERIAVSGSTTI